MKEVCLTHSTRLRQKVFRLRRLILMSLFSPFQQAALIRSQEQHRMEVLLALTEVCVPGMTQPYPYLSGRAGGVSYTCYVLDDPEKQSSFTETIFGKQNEVNNYLQEMRGKSLTGIGHVGFSTG